MERLAVFTSHSSGHNYTEIKKQSQQSNYIFAGEIRVSICLIKHFILMKI